jgi:type IV pilus assembly protein PilW
MKFHNSFLKQPKINNQSGVGLIELLVSMVIGLFIMAGVLQLMSTSSRNAVATAGSSRIQENVRYAFNRIADDITQSGNLGDLSTTVNATIGAALPAGEPSPIRNMLNTTNNAYDFRNIVSGENNTTDGNGSLTPDTLRIRYIGHGLRMDIPPGGVLQNSISVSAAAGTLNQITQGEIVFAGNCERGAIFMVTDVAIVGSIATVEHDATVLNGINNAETDTNMAGWREGDCPQYFYAGETGVYEYFIGDSDGGDCDANMQECSLFRGEPGGASLPIVQGVHDFQVEYGSTNAAGNLIYEDAPASWDDVDRVKITMSFNSIENATNDGDVIERENVTRVINLYNQL